VIPISTPQKSSFKLRRESLLDATKIKLRRESLLDATPSRIPILMIYEDSQAASRIPSTTNPKRKRGIHTILLISLLLASLISTLSPKGRGHVAPAEARRVAWPSRRFACGGRSAAMFKPGEIPPQK